VTNDLNITEKLLSDVINQITKTNKGHEQTPILTHTNKRLEEVTNYLTNTNI